MKKIKDYLSKCDPGGDQYIIIVEVRDDEDGGVAIADENKMEEREQSGEIVSLGPGRLPENGIERQPMQYKKGQKVVFKKHAGDDYYLDKDLKRHPPHEDLRNEYVPVRVLRQDSILHSIPS